MAYLIEVGEHKKKAKNDLLLCLIYMEENLALICKSYKLVPKNV